jgi:2-oxoglutarate ferredoxin oxidoreductase subunit alpha
MNDFVDLSFELAFKYRNPAMILTDGVIGQMMEKVELSDFKPRMSPNEIEEKYGSWATLGKPKNRGRNIITSLEMDSHRMEVNNRRFQEKYKQMEELEVRYEEIQCDDADYVLVAFGSSARICQKAVDIARNNGLKSDCCAPLPCSRSRKKPIGELANGLKGFLTVEMNAGRWLKTFSWP